MLLSTVSAWIGIGANIGDDPIGTVRAAISALGKQAHCQLISHSSLYSTAPIGCQGLDMAQPDYINAVAHIETALGPALLLESLLALEATFGRTRSVQNAPRTLDLDLLLFADRVIDQACLQVPHPRMHERAFVLAPLAEIAPELVIPGQGAVTELLTRIADQSIARLP